MAAKILIADDEKDIADMLSLYFRGQGYTVFTAYCGNDAVIRAGQSPDIILLDINMPDMDGLKVCRRIREYMSCPIIFLTARIEDSDKIMGFASGGDDYVVKPFSIDELGARVAAHLRRERRQATSPALFFDGNTVINYSDRTVRFHGRNIPFARKEFDIIEFLSQNPGIVFDKERIYENVWGYDGEGDSSVVAEHIRRIRAKLSAAGAGSFIETVWGCGYKWKRQ